MPDVAIGSLEPVSEVFGSDLFVLEQSGEAKKLSGAKLAEYIDRQIISVSVTQLDAGATPTASFVKATGRLTLGIPKGNGIANITSSNNGNSAIITFDDGTTKTLNLVKGDTGMTAYEYARSKGFVGTEEDFANSMLELAQAAQAEADRVSAEEQRNADFEELAGIVQDKLDEFQYLIDYADSEVVNHTLLMYRGGVRLYEHTLLL